VLRCLLFAMVALGVLTAPAGAAFPGANGRIVWSSGGDLWTDAGRLTDTPHVEEAQASWSPDGRRIAFRVGTPGAGVPLRIFVMDADGSDRRQVGAQRSPRDPARLVGGRDTDRLPPVGGRRGDER
jgi:dipeptidyl aminopeptidase/acylaminoacyl peptidase